MPASSSLRHLLTDPLVEDNPLIYQVLGICSALAVTAHLNTAFVMSVALTLVTGFSSFFISILRRWMPTNVRIIIQMTVIASLVIIADQVMKAYLYEVEQKLSVYVGLIITNCIVMGRAEAFAMHNKPIPSLIDGIGNGAGYGLVLILLGVVREFFGTGQLWGMTILKTSVHGGWYVPLNLMLSSPSAFFLLALLVLAVRPWVAKQMEPSPYKLWRHES